MERIALDSVFKRFDGDPITAQQKLRAIVAVTGWKQKYIADLIGVDQGNLSNTLNYGLMADSYLERLRPHFEKWRAEHLERLNVYLTLVKAI